MNRLSLQLPRLIKPFIETTSQPILFIIGIVLFNLISNALYDWIKIRISAPIMILLLILAVFILIILLIYLVNRWFRRRIVVTEIQPRRGLVVLVSQGQLAKIPAKAAIKYHFRGENDERDAPTLERCWLVTSGEPDVEPIQPSPGGSPSQSAWKNAHDLESEYKAHLQEISIVEVNPEDPQDVFQKIEQIYKHIRAIGMAPREVVADLTGGTKVMTSGMALFCALAGNDLEYLKPRGFFPDGRADPNKGSTPIRIDLAYMLNLERE
ncbi:MAG: hypothetical protein IT316_12250 [Anaerolineales bacterium]|nr:hypothetical protein [Anaerolineales bacterium]